MRLDRPAQPYYHCRQKDFNARPRVARPFRAMADIDVQRESLVDEEDYSYAEIAYWVIGILMIPLAPILMIWLFTPWSGM